jgi:hypothetical protein
MGSLSNLYISASYTSLVHLGNDGPITSLAPGQFVALQDGLGNNLQIELNNSGDVNIGGILSASNIPTDIATQAELNAYTQSTNIRLNNIETTTASLNISISNINSFTSSQNTKNTTLEVYTASVNTKFDAVGGSTASLNVFTASNGNTSLNAYTASQDTKNATLEVYTASVNTKFNAVGGSTSSLNAFTASQQSFNASATASILELLNLSSSLSGGYVTEGELAAATGSLINQINTKLNTSSFNAYTQSNDNKVNSLINATSSYAISSSVALVDYNQQQQINSLIAVTASFLTSSADISSLNAFTASQETKNSTLESVTASFSSSINQLNASSASQQISINALNTNSASVNISISNLNTATASLFTSTSLSLTTASFNSGTRNLTFTKGDTSTFSVNIPDVSGSTNYVTTSSFEAYTASVNSDLASIHSTTASLNLATASFSSSINNLNSFTQSQTSINTDVANSASLYNAKWNTLGGQTGSYVTSAITASSLVTASVNLNTITFTKGDATTFSINVNTGSATDISSLNQFTASQNTINTNVSASQSIDTTKWDTLQNVTSSLIAATASYAISSSVSTLVSSSIQNISASLTVTDTYLQAQITALDVSGSAASLAALNAFTASQNTKNSTLETYTASVDTKFTAVGSSTSSLNAFTSSANQRLSSLETNSASVLTQLNTLANVTSSLISKTGSYATTGSNNFIGDQTITGNLTAFSASFTYLQTIYESSSIIYSSGSNQFGDELTDVQTLSGSVKVQGSLTVNGTPVLTSSVDISGLVTTASFNAYTSSNNQRVSSLETNSASVNISISNINSTTASLNSSVSNLNQFTASQTTASIVSSLNNLNTFSASTLIRLTNIESTTASLNNSITNINSFTQSANQRIESLEAATSSYVTSAITASSLITASVNLNTITFTKGDTSTFNIVVNTGSAITTNITSLNEFTASQYVSNSYFATTGSNTFRGIQTFDTNNSNFIVTNGASSQIKIEPTPNETRLIITNPDISIIRLISSGQTTNNLYDITIDGNANTGSLFIGTADQEFTYAKYTDKGQTILFNKIDISGSLNVTGSISASLPQGFTYVGDANGRTALVATSSFGGGSIPAGTISSSAQITSLGFVSSSITASSLVTASVNLNTITFTKGDASTFNITVNTGSATDISSLNAFTASQYVSNSYFATTASLNDYTQSTNIRLNNLESTSASVNVSISNLNSATSSFDTSITNLNTATQSLFTSTSLSLTTASVNLNTITFTKGDTSTFNIVVNTGSAVTTDITALNSFTASQETKNTTLENVTSSLNSATASLFSSASLALVTGSVAINVLTFTKGDGSTFNLAVAASGSAPAGTVSSSAQILNYNIFATTASNVFTGIQTFQDAALNATSLVSTSGSLMLVAKTFTSASAHLTSSAANFVNLIFKNNNNTADTIISGSNNIFTNPQPPTAGYKRYIGGSNNLHLNNTTAIAVQITASAASVSGNRPSMNNNIFQGVGDFIINQAVNTGTHDYSQNFYNGGSTTTINALAFTGSLNFNNNFNVNGSATINAASASLAQIASGLSGSGTLSVQNNGNFGGQLNITSPRRLLTTNTQSAAQNILAAGNITVTNISSSAAVNANSNYANGVMSYTNAGAAGLGLHTSQGAMNFNYGALTVIASASAVASNLNYSQGPITITNQAWSSSLGVGQFAVSRNIFNGQSTTLLITGSVDGPAGSTPGAYTDNAIIGRSNSIFSNQSGAGFHNSFLSNVVGGENLIISASNSFTSTIGGGAYFGRYNANDGRRNKTGETVFLVGTGNSTARKTGLLIDSGSNMFVEGTLNVSGSTTMTGSLILSSSNATELFVIGNSEFSGTLSIQSGSSFFANGNKQFNVGAFQSNITQSGSANVSQSMNFETTDISSGISIASNSRITLANSGTYNIQFSAQLNADTGADTIWIWLKKNGTNVSSTTTKLVLANNEANVAAWNFVVDSAANDYFELVWQSVNGHAKLLTEPAAGNYPAIPSIILTVTQVR